jgi:hypothetical protein
MAESRLGAHAHPGPHCMVKEGAQLAARTADGLGYGDGLLDLPQDLRLTGH